MILRSLGTSLQCPEFLEILYMGHLLSYCIFPEGIAILIIKLDSILKIPRNLESIIVLYIVPD